VSGQRKALIIAVDEYEQEGLGDLLAPGADAEALGRVLGDANIGGFAVRVVRNQPSYVIEEQIEDLFSESKPDDVLLLHFSGHGLKNDSGDLFFAASNTRPNRLGSTAVPADFVERCMRSARSRSVVLLLDCCYGGAFAQGVRVRAAGDANVLDSFPQGKSGGGRGRAVITASNAIEYAFEGGRLADDQSSLPSVFTSALVEGLATGDADRDEDGLISLTELYDYVFDKVRDRNPHQTPSRQIELEGELYLARSRRRRIRPAPIPSDLQAALADPNMYARSGAVHELETRLVSQDLPIAAGAYEALTELARTDIQYVANLAATALRHAAIQPDETELKFGQFQQGAASPHRTVRLLGPPIARACVPRASHDWISVTDTAEGLDVGASTSGTGTLRGTITLTGPTGTAEIAVEAEISPKTAQAAPGHRQRGPVSAEVTEPAAAVDHLRSTGSRHVHDNAGDFRASQQTAAALPSARRVVSRLTWWAPGLAGLLAVAGSVLAVASLRASYTNYDFFSREASAPGWSLFVTVTAALYLTAGICTLVPHWRRSAGRGLLLATMPSSTAALAYNVVNERSLSNNAISVGHGWWLQIGSTLSLILAAGLITGVLAQDHAVRLIRRPIRGPLSWVVVLLAVTGTQALVIQNPALLYPGYELPGPMEVSFIAAAFWALITPALAATTEPRRLGGAIIAGWIWTGAAFGIFYYIYIGSQGARLPVIMFSLTLLALAAATIPFAREETTALPERKA
jgi:hypothetical protein